MAINLNPTSGHSLNLTVPADQLTLSSDRLDDKSVKLNGRILELGKDDQLPALQPEKRAAGNLDLAPASITFLAIPDANNTACQMAQVTASSFPGV